jgi:non-specific serine/threonine protein kinase
MGAGFMSADGDLIRNSFDELVDLDEALRAKRLAELDPTLRREVESLLQAATRGDAVRRELEHATGSGSREPSEIGIGSRIGQYEILERLGEGGMGVVYRARDRKLDRDVALKFLPAAVGEDRDATVRFLNEARAASGLDHPHIATIYEAGETPEGKPFIAMAYSPGTSLKERIARKDLSLEAIVDIGLAVAQGLQRAHEAGIVHRDIKPSNVFITERGEAKILDFGIAKRAGVDLTRSGVALGTLAYMSPEQIQHDAADGRCDLWSLGVVLYEAISGSRPFPADHHATLLYQVLSHTPEPLSQVRRDTPEGLVRVVHKCLERSIEDRYATAAEVARDLEAIRAERPVAAGEVKRKNTLPAPLTSFVGRRREIEAVYEMLGRLRLVTITGPPGIGKTRLATEVAREVAEGRKEEVHFISLAAVTEPERTLGTLLEALGEKESPGMTLLEALGKRLGERPALLVLDNFEQLVEAAPSIAEVLALSPRTRILVTSRLPLRVGGEHEFAVPPLQVPVPESITGSEVLEDYAATRLFLERVRAVQPQFQATESNARTIAEICARLDGLPLAIELAAARIKMFSPQALLSRLDRSLDVLTGGGRDLPARQRTLRQAIAWSYNLLEEDEKTFFRMLGIFRGGWTIDAAEEVCGKEATDRLSALVDKSLVSRKDGSSGEPRFFLLELIREFALEKLIESGDFSATRKAHLATFIDLAERAEPNLTGADQSTWSAALKDDHDNLREALAQVDPGTEGEQALRLGAALWRFWIMQGHLREGRARLSAVIALSGASKPSQARARVLHGLGTIVFTLLGFAAARPILEEALATCRALDYRKGLALTLNSLGFVRIHLGDYEGALATCSEGLALNRELGEMRGTAVALNNLGWLTNHTGQFKDSVAYFEESLEYRRNVKDPRGVGFALINMAWSLIWWGRFDRARVNLHEAEEVVRSLDDAQIPPWAVEMRGYLHLAKGEFDEAVRLLQDSLPAWRKIGNPYGTAICLVPLGEALAELGRSDDARPALDEAMKIFEEMLSPWGTSWGHLALGRLAEREGDGESARGRYRQALRGSFGLRHRWRATGSLESLARVLGPGDEAKAVRLLGASERSREEMDAPILPRDHTAMREARERLRKKLGAEGYDGAVSEGRGLSLEAAVEIALSEGH